MRFVDRKVVVARITAVGVAHGIDARGLGDTPDTLLDCCTEGVVATYHIVVVHDMARMVKRSWDSRKMDQAITTGKCLLEPIIVGHI